MREKNPFEGNLTEKELSEKFPLSEQMRRLAELRSALRPTRTKLSWLRKLLIWVSR